MLKLEAVERIAAKPSFLLAFNAGVAALWVSFGVDVSNIFISIVTAELVLLSLGAQRRSNAGVHAKLDELVVATKDARDDVAHIEDMAEDEIQEKRL